MNRLTKMRFFDITVKYSRREITFEEVESAFNEFADYVVVLSNAESEHSTLYRIITYTRTRLQTLQGRVIPNEAEKMHSSSIILMMLLEYWMQNWNC